MTVARRVPLRCLAALFAATAAAGCSDDSADKSGMQAAAASAKTAETRMEGDCRVTLPNRSVPPYEEHRPGTRNLYLGNGRIWTGLWPHGVTVARRGDVAPDGSVSMKYPWWRGVRGALHITGRRLDAPAAALRARIPRGYGRIGFQSTALIFASKGCWEVTGRVRDARLTFVTLVRVGGGRR
jgi:hypothetical protein